MASSQPLRVAVSLALSRGSTTAHTWMGAIQDGAAALSQHGALQPLHPPHLCVPSATGTTCPYLLPLQAWGKQAPPYTLPQSLAYLLPWRSLHVLLRLSLEWQLRTLICELAPPMSVPTRGCLPSPRSASGSLGFPVQALDDFYRNSRRLEGEAGAGGTYSRRASFLPLGLATALTCISGPLCVFQVP